MMRGMNLTSYFIEKGGTGTPTCPVLAKTAKKARCSAGTLYQVSRGLRQAGPKLAPRISAATGGEVTRADLRPDVWGFGEAA